MGGLDTLGVNKDTWKHLWPALAFLIPLAAFFWPDDFFSEIFFGSVKRAQAQRIGLLGDIVAVIFSPFTKVVAC